MSMFNYDMICEPCKNKELKLPEYAAAEHADNEQIRLGNWNFEGIGYPALKKNPKISAVAEERKHSELMLDIFRFISLYPDYWYSGEQKDYLSELYFYENYERISTYNAVYIKSRMIIEFNGMNSCFSVYDRYQKQYSFIHVISCVIQKSKYNYNNVDIESTFKSIPLISEISDIPFEYKVIKSTDGVCKIVTHAILLYNKNVFSISKSSIPGFKDKFNLTYVDLEKGEVDLLDETGLEIVIEFIAKLFVFSINKKYPGVILEKDERESVQFVKSQREYARITASKAKQLTSK
jgi:hypothetical protein